MPLLRIETNCTRCRVPKDFHKTTSELVAQLLGKPQERISVTVITDLIMSRDGSTEPCAFASLLSIGGQGKEENKHLSSALSSHIERFLGISKKRLLIHFVDESPRNLGNDGTTFEELLKPFNLKDEATHVKDKKIDKDGKEMGKSM